MESQLNKQFKQLMCPTVKVDDVKLSKNKLNRYRMEALNKIEKHVVDIGLWPEKASKIIEDNKVSIDLILKAMYKEIGLKVQPYKLEKIVKEYKEKVKMLRSEEYEDEIKTIPKSMSALCCCEDCIRNKE